MDYKSKLGINNNIFNTSIDNYFLSQGFYYDTMSPRFMNGWGYNKLNLDKPCLRYDGDWDHDGHGVQRIFINKNEMYIERQTSYRSYDDSDYVKFEKPPSTIEEIEYYLNKYVKSYEC